MANQPLLRMRPRKLPNSAKERKLNSHYAVQGHSRSPILEPIESPYAKWLIGYTNLAPILHRFRIMAEYWSNFRYRHGSASL